MDADALACCIARTSATMIMSMQCLSSKKKDFMHLFHLNAGVQVDPC